MMLSAVVLMVIYFIARTHYSSVATSILKDSKPRQVVIIFRFAAVACCAAIGPDLPLARHLAVTPELQGTPLISPGHRLNMELNLQSLFGLLCTTVLIGPANSPLPLRLGSYVRALLVSQDRRHLFVTPCFSGEKNWC
jgi:hypothetical protein